MGRYRPNLIDGMAGLALGGGAADRVAPPARAVHPLTAAELAGHGSREEAEPLRRPLISEPEPGTATLADWIAYRRRVGPLAGRDPAMRLALAVAETQIAKLRRRMGGRRRAPSRNDAGPS